LRKEVFSMIRKAYVKKIESMLENWGDEIGRLRVRAEKAGEDAKGIYQEQLVVLRAKQEIALTRLRELGEAGVDNWGKLKTGVDASVNDLKKAVENAIDKLRKIA
jgi:hypothetical protein